MTVLWVNEVGGRNQTQGEGTQRRAKQIFDVFTDDRTHTPPQILAATGIPLLFAVCPWDSNLFAYDLQTDQNGENPFLWKVTIQYTSLSFGINGKTDPSQRDPNPTARPALIDIDTEEYMEAVLYDINGSPLRNSANDPFDPPFELQRYMPVIRITKNVASGSFDYSTIKDYNGAKNSDTFLGFSPGELRIWLRASREFEENQFFWKLEATIKVREITTVDIGEGPESRGGWFLDTYDIGFRARHGDGSYTILKDAHTGQQLQNPAFLRDGLEISPDDTPATLRFDIYPEENFAALGIIP
jgi:hypothetical protein